MCRQNLGYSCLYAESNKFLLVESTFILDIVSRIREHADKNKTMRLSCVHFGLVMK